MELTKKETEICRDNSVRNRKGVVNCSKCPLLIDRDKFMCYATVSDEEAEELGLKRFL